jgi:hypothetical protein
METKKLISNFVVNIFEKDYSKADLTLKQIISEKTKNKIKEIVSKKKNKKNHDCECETKKNNKKVSKKG